MRNKILIVHPSRERIKLAQETYENVMQNTDNKENILYTLALDNDDPQLKNYPLDSRYEYVTVQDNKCIVDAVNTIYPYFKSRINEIKFVIIISDDMRLCEHWDTRLSLIFNEYDYTKALQTMQPKGNPNLLTLPICGYQFFLDYGTFYYPKYKSMFADDDMTQWAHIVCPHLHPSLDIPNRIAIDNTYHRENNNEFAEIGRAVFKQRQQEGFPAYHE
jgi:hypothetical protein